MSLILELRQLVDAQAFDDALALYRRIPERFGARLEFCRILAHRLVFAGRDADALPLVAEAESLQPRLAWVSYLRATMAARAGDAVGHQSLLKMAFELDPGDGTIAEAWMTALQGSARADEAAVALQEHRAHTEQAMARLPLWREPDRPRKAGAAQTARALYLDLLERTVSNWIYGDARNQLGHLLPFSEETRRVGRDIPAQAHTMIGLRRLRHLRVMAEDALRRGVAGDFVETGVWRGGACILLAGVLKAHQDGTRRVVVADSFEGLPPPDPRYDKDALSAFDFHLRPELAVGLDEVKSNFDRYALLDERVVFLKGYFRDTLPTYAQGPIAVLRLDGDLYSSTMDALAHLYDRVSPGGCIIIDDYGVVIDARRATLDFRLARGITVPMMAVDGDAVFWHKPA